MAKFWFRRITFLLVLISLFYFGFSYIISFSDSKSIISMQYLPKKQTVINYVKILAHPYYTSKNRSHLNITLELESFQNPELLTENIMDFVFLEDMDENAYKPAHFHLEDQSEFAIKGVLTFENVPDSLESFQLRFFFDDEASIEWSVKEG